MILFRYCFVFSYNTLKSAVAALGRNGTRIYPILFCHFMTQNQKLWCSPETFRLSFYGIQGVPKKISAQLERCNQSMWKPTFCIPNASGMHIMSFYVILINFCKANFYVTCHSSDQDSRGPLAQNGSVEDRGSFHKSSSMYFMHT